MVSKTKAKTKQKVLVLRDGRYVRVCVGMNKKKRNPGAKKEKKKQ